jgi:hypothetical protein
MRVSASFLLVLGACASDTVGLPDPGGRADASVNARVDAPPASSMPPDAAGVPDAGPDAPPPSDAAPADAPPVTGDALRQCTGREFPKHAAGEFEHFGSDLISNLKVEHAGFDVLAVAGTSVVGNAKLQYGPTFKDLEDEWVRVYLDDCADWKLLGQGKTNGDGRVSWTFGELGAGIYDVRWEVVGDATTAAAQLWVLPAGTHLTVFDIDGTLTTSDFELIKDLFSELVSGDYVPEAYPAGVELTQAYRASGWVPLYMTGRPYYLTRVTREWLADLGYVRGPLFLARDNAEAVPSEGGVGTFKRDSLLAIDAAGFHIDSAQGNATTDIFAYLGAGIPAEKVWIIGEHAGESGTQPVMDTWAAHVDTVESWPAPEQPFEW